MAAGKDLRGLPQHIGVLKAAIDHSALLKGWSQQVEAGHEMLQSVSDVAAQLLSLALHKAHNQKVSETRKYRP